MSNIEVIVVGAGVVGLSSALELQAKGMSVRVIDKVGPAGGASAGNAGAFAFSEILPLASPKTIMQSPKWLFDPLGPLSIPPSYAPKIAPWMLRFLGASRPAQVKKSTHAQAEMMRHAKKTLEPFLLRAGLTHMLRNEGQLQVYEGEKQFQATLPGYASLEAENVPFTHLKGDSIADYQPGLSPRFTHATFTPAYATIDDPKLYTITLAEKFVANGGELLIGEVKSLTSDGVHTSLGDFKGRVVLAAGAYSHHLARTAGVKIPLETERGYNTTLPNNAFNLKQHLTFGGHGFVISKLRSGLRVGGSVELGGLNLPPNFARAQAMLNKAKEFLPGLKTEGGIQWMGFRPSLPDSLPAIGVLPSNDNVICAFGHGHLGLTQSTATAALVADIVTATKPAIDIKPFSPSRFASWL
ncbi:FAD-dependent oxidoreductase [Ahrensia kielensis]|uniref:FAD-dependent oxidoreductase n=1 Tax=Ahrensia kielensis TaxID=76980 RepID=A0ABU9T283_9HYPH